MSEYLLYLFCVHFIQIIELKIDKVILRNDRLRIICIQLLGNIVKIVKANVLRAEKAPMVIRSKK
jgi:hypothetical protein